MKRVRKQLVNNEKAHDKSQSVFNEKGINNGGPVIVK